MSDYLRSYIIAFPKLNTALVDIISQSLSNRGSQIQPDQARDIIMLRTSANKVGTLVCVKDEPPPV